jgi:hypothetical protein
MGTTIAIIKVVLVVEELSLLPPFEEPPFTTIVEVDTCMPATVWLLVNRF